MDHFHAVELGYHPGQSLQGTAGMGYIHAVERGYHPGLQARITSRSTLSDSDIIQANWHRLQSHFRVGVLSCPESMGLILIVEHGYNRLQRALITFMDHIHVVECGHYPDLRTWITFTRRAWLPSR